MLWIDLFVFNNDNKKSECYINQENRKCKGGKHCCNFVICDETELELAWSVSWQERVECIIHFSVMMERGDAGRRGGDVWRLWGGHTKVEYIKASMGSNDFWFCDLLGGSCEENLI